jgi:bifunctional UDP-N-acetylglucosamine pyrophosphorylase/glucosamine-1-phosphate N-acetyltransferase
VRNHTVVADSTVEAGAFLGPFAHIRPGSQIGEDAHIGNFVELKKTTVGKGAKANHLAYLGDATIGATTNIGAGTITCNYDGEQKHQTVIGKGVFVGSNSTLVAPVTLADGSYIAAGSAVTADVPAGALAIGRARQENKDGWAAKRKEAKAKS